jgi:hypothetical protein
VNITVHAAFDQESAGLLWICSSSFGGFHMLLAISSRRTYGCAKVSDWLHSSQMNHISENRFIKENILKKKREEKKD